MLLYNLMGYAAEECPFDLEVTIMKTRTPLRLWPETSW
jgi:hypothetical protein